MFRLNGKKSLEKNNSIFFIFIALLCNYIFANLSFTFIPLFICIQIILFLTINKFNYKYNPLIFYFLILIVLYFSKPLYENDHFRYFFEGKMLLEGVNVYKLAPSQVKGILPSYFNEIGFKEVPSIYGPISHLFHGLVIKIFNFDWALYIVQCIYLLIFLFLIQKLNFPRLLIIAIPFFSKEFINSIHLDFLAVLFFVYGIKQFDLKIKHSQIALLISFLIKPTGIIAMPFIIYKSFKNKSFISWLIFFTISLAYSYYFFNLPGFKIFFNEWYWNAGIFYLFEIIQFGNLRYLHLILPIVLQLIYLLKNDDNSYKLLAKVFLIQILFSSTVNSWYLVWPLMFCILANRIFSTYILLFIWPFCYYPWLENDSVFISQILFHVLAWISFVLLFFDEKLIKEKIKCKLFQ